MFGILKITVYKISTGNKLSKECLSKHLHLVTLLLICIHRIENTCFLNFKMNEF